MVRGRTSRSIMRDVDAACRDLVARLGRDGWLAAHRARPTASGALDVRTLCLARETLARHDGLADFAFAMQGLGAGAISLFGTPEQQHVAEEDARGRGHRRLRADRAEIGLRCRQHRDDRRAGRRISGGSTARRPGSRTAASPTSTSSSRAPAKRPARRAFPPSSCRPIRDGLADRRAPRDDRAASAGAPSLRQRARARHPR